MNFLSRNPTSVSTESPSRAAVGIRPHSGDKWLFLLYIILFVWIALPWLAPIFMQIGWESLAKPIYWLYSHHGFGATGGLQLLEGFR